MSPRQGDGGGSRHEAEELSALEKKGWTPDMLRQTTEESTEFAQLRRETRSPGGTDYPAGTSLENVLTWRQQRDAKKKPVVDSSSGDPLYEKRPDHQVPTPERWFAMEQREIDHANGWLPSDANSKARKRAYNATYEANRRTNPETEQDYVQSRRQYREDPEVQQYARDRERVRKVAKRWAKARGQDTKAAGAEASKWVGEVREAKWRFEKEEQGQHYANKLTLEQQLQADRKALKDYKAGGLAEHAARGRTRLTQEGLERRIGVAESALGASGMEQQLLADQEALKDYKAGGLAARAAQGRTRLPQKGLEQRIKESEAQRRAFMTPPWLRQTDILQTEEEREQN
ncbi:MAG TPA: hypothetical protein VL485_29190 [Ktedonobacteraceae bacterium]|jgi:hypothetical protein|nr:hypothetical protein [Ktedonobacteraceae bacterium]